MRRLLVFLPLLLFATALFAIPALRGVKQQVTQSDGTVLTVELRGDEHLHYYVTDDNIPVVRSAVRNDFCYAQVFDSKLVPSSFIAHGTKNRSAEEVSYISSLNNSATALLSAAKQSRAKRMKISRNALPATTFTDSSPWKIARKTAVGERRGLVILVNFADKSFTTPSPKATFDAYFNQVGYTGNNQHGSVHDYFLAQSANQFSLDFDVIGPVTLSNGYAYYGEDDGGDGYDKRPGAMISEACKLITDSVNFADYDWNDDKLVDQVYVLYAGYGQAQGGSSNTVWPHEWDLSDSDYGDSLAIDGVYVNTYACSCELRGGSGHTIDGVGTTCHEFSHCLGLPDFYDTEGSSFGMNRWDLMDYGCYNGSISGNCPSGYTSYEKMVCGWLKPIVLNNDTSISGMAAISDYGNAYLIYNDNHTDEYFLLENRQETEWDQYLYGHGLLILHVDYDADVWLNNVVNNEADHQRMTILPADGGLNSFSLSGDPYPGSGNVTSVSKFPLFNAYTTGLKSMLKSLSDITEKDGVITFSFKGVNSETAVTAPRKDDAQDAIQAIYTLGGMRMPGTSLESLPHGTYIVKGNNGTHKIIIK
jgi:M6 family metalloprotease-like protein